MVQKLGKVDDNLEFKNIIAASNSQGTNNIMALIPYAKDVTYENGLLSMTLEFVNDYSETEVGIKMMVSDELQEIFGNIMYGEV
jgi:hypothetical protein